MVGPSLANHTIPSLYPRKTRKHQNINVTRFALSPANGAGINLLQGTVPPVEKHEGPQLQTHGRSFSKTKIGSGKAEVVLGPRSVINKRKTFGGGGLCQGCVDG